MKGSQGNPNASFYVQMRRHERQIFRDALVYSDWDVDEAAKMLGVSASFIRSRGHRLGGVFEGEEPAEPYEWETKVDKATKQEKLRAQGKKFPWEGRFSNEKPKNKLPPSGPVVDDQSEPTDESVGGSDRDDFDQGRNASDDHQPGDGEHLQPD